MQKMSGVQKAPGSVELKPPDKGEQPMDLAPRTAHQHVAAAASAAKPTQLQVTTIGPALRPHLDTAKSAFTTLGQRLPASSRPVLQPAISVSSTGGNVVAASVTPSYTVKSVGGSSVPQLSTLRHMVTPSATGVSSPNAGTIVTSIASPMASIIRGNTITTTQIGHTASHQFSSHVPRGPAAVASINTAPKSALATPMLRSSMSQATTAPHIPVGRTRPVYKMTRWIAKFHEPVEEFIREDFESAQQARAAGLVPARASFASIPRSAGLSMAQVMDLQKSGSHGGAGQVQIGFASGRSLEPLARTTLGHSSVSIAKPLHVTQPIVHSLHQVPEKTFKCSTSPAAVQYTAVPGLATGTAGHSAVIASSPSPLTTSNSSTASCGATIVSPHAQVVQPSVPIRSNMGTMSLVTLAPTSVVQSTPQVVATCQPASLHGSNLATGGSGIHPIFTVVSGKSPLSVAPASTAPSIGLPQNRLAGASRLVTTASPAVQPTSVQVAGSVTRPVTTTVAIQPPTMSVPTVSVVKTRPEDASKDDRRYVPGTKVFGPTSLVGSAASLHAGAGLEAAATVSEPTGNLFVTGTAARNLTTTISSVSSNIPTTASPLPATVVISDTRTDRPAQLQGAAATPSYAVPATYLYESYPIQGATITMHPYAAATPAGVTPVFPVTSARPSRPHLVTGSAMPSSATTVVHPPQPLQQQQQQQQAQLSQPQPTATHIGALSLGASPALGAATTLGSPSPLGAASPLGANSLASTVVPTMGAAAGQVVNAVPLGTGQATPSAVAVPPPLASTQQPLGAAATLGVASPLSSAMGSGPLGATTVRAPLMVAVDSMSSRQQQQHQQQLVSHSALHAQPTGFTSTGLTAHSNSGSDGVVTSQPSSAPAQPYSCVTPSNLLSPTHSSTPPNHNTSPRPSILRKRTFESAHLSVKKNLMASLPGSEPASPRSEAPASLSTTSSPKPASDIQQESSNSSSTASDPLLPEASKSSSLPIVNIKQEPPDTCETPPNGNASVLPAHQNSTVEASPRKKPRKQLLCANEFLDTHSTDGDDDIEKESRENLKKEFSRGGEHS
ncbi:uncharacterized protein LOC119457949 [Dermacentor silvarum]|uniref:uncharacterized protein LOC119457949 n=1 Tax=Dermacentor silvarum TaxID=543639 RepID=UPI0018987D85|nr:uncharacterized protein LOC119457949 [Dermacentor silvarum]